MPRAWITRVQPDPRDPRTAYVTYSGFRAGDDPAYLLKTTDAGATWTNITGDLPAAPLNDVNVVGDILVVASDVGVFGSADGGARWVRMGSGLPMAPVHELRYHKPMNSLFVATFGRSMWKVPFPPASAFAQVSEPPPPATRSVAVIRARLSGKRLRVALRCRSATPCRGSAVVRRASGSARQRKQILARGSFSLAANRSGVAALRLGPAGRKALRRGGRIKLTVVLRPDDAGPGATTRSTLKVPRPKR